MRKDTGKVANCTNPKGYIVFHVRDKNYRAHRLAFLYMTGKFPENQVDHINHVKNDNKWSNLRLVDNQENHKNAKLSKNNASGFNGVYWSKRRSRWGARIKVHGKGMCLGLFKEIEDAINARQLANVKYGFHENHGMAI